MALPYQILLFLVVIVATTNKTTGYLLSSSQCVVPTVCACRSSSISCAHGSLQNMPTFEIVGSSTDMRFFGVDFSYNQISSIPDYVFQNISSVNTSQMTIYFQNNKLSIIHPNAFEGVANKISTLGMGNNELDSLSPAFGKLSNLRYLYLDGNPIISLDSSVMSQLSGSLFTLRIDMDHFKSWPYALNTLHNLQSMTINFIPFSSLPLNAFDGIHSLTSLTMSFSKLERLPDAICHLDKLYDLNFESNSQLESNLSIVHVCSNQLTHLKDAFFKHNSFYRFPDFLQYFPSLYYLDLDDNDIRSIETDVIPSFSGIERLFLQRNQLTHVPFALNKLKSLTNLFLAGNQITTIEDNALIGLSNLKALELNINPISYVAPNAFMHNAQMTSLNLDSTNLHLVPEAVRSLPSLRHLYLQNNTVDCNCSMSYLKGWDVTAVYDFQGNCTNQQNDEIVDYLVISLPNCP